jgi:hypothetical protein
MFSFQMCLQCLFGAKCIHIYSVSRYEAVVVRLGSYGITGFFVVVFVWNNTRWCLDGIGFSMVVGFVSRPSPYELGGESFKWEGLGQEAAAPGDRSRISADSHGDLSLAGYQHLFLSPS